MFYIYALAQLFTKTLNKINYHFNHESKNKQKNKHINLI